jgi:hypothetical protein
VHDLTFFVSTAVMSVNTRKNPTKEMLIGAKEGLILTTKCRALSVMVLYFLDLLSPMQT